MFCFKKRCVDIFLFLFLFLFINPSFASINNPNNPNNSQLILLKNIKDSLINIQDENKDKWDKYVSLKAKELYPKVPYPAWKLFVSQNSVSANNDGISINNLISDLTNNKFLKYILSNANNGYVSSDLTYPLNLGLNKSIASSSILQIERLNSILILKNYQSQVEQNRELNRITKLLNVLIVNNFKAQQKQSKQLDKLILLLKNNSKN